MAGNEFYAHLEEVLADAFHPDRVAVMNRETLEKYWLRLTNIADHLQAERRRRDFPWSTSEEGRKATRQHIDYMMGQTGGKQSKAY